MRTLKLHFPDDALPTLDTFVKQTKEARVFRRAQAVREVVKGQRLQTVSDTLSLYLFRPAQVGLSLCQPGHAGAGGSPALRSTAQSHLRVGTAPQSPRRSRPPAAWLPLFPMELSRTRHRRWPTRPGSSSAVKVSAVS